MTSLKQYKQRFIAVCVVQAFCAAGCFAGFLPIVQRMIAHDRAIVFTYFTVIFTAICVGVMSPQWLIQLLINMASAARHWITGKSKEDKPLKLWLPRDRTDPLPVTMAMAGCILLISFLFVVATMLASPLESLLNTIENRFILGSVALYILDTLIIIILLFPAWSLFGLLVGLLYRLGLSFTTSTGKFQDFEQSIPAFLCAGMAVGLAIWKLIVPGTITPVMCIWCSQLIATFSILLLVIASPRFALVGNQKSFEASAVMLQCAPRHSLGMSIVVMFCGVLTGISFPLLCYLLNLTVAISWLIKLYWAVAILSLAVGMYWSFTKGKKKKKTRPYMVISLLGWAVSCLLTILTFWLSWKVAQAEPSSKPLATLLALLFCSLLIVTMVWLGAVLSYSKQLLQAATVSRSLGWAIWLTEIIIGIISGWFLAIFFMLGSYGSLMIMAILILLAILFAGIFIIYQDDEFHRQKKILFYCSFGLILLSSAAVSAIAPYWLSPGAGISAVVRETINTPWALFKNDQDEKTRTCKLPLSRADKAGQESFIAQANSQHLRRFLTSDKRQSVLILGMDANVWPLESSGSKKQVDLLLDQCVYDQLDRLSLLPAHTGNSGSINAIPSPLYQWRRHTYSKKHYNLIWLRLDRNDFQSNPKYKHYSWWLNLRQMLTPEGELLIQIDTIGQQTPLSQKALDTISRMFNRQVCHVTPTSQSTTTPISTQYYIAFKNKTKWLSSCQKNQLYHIKGRIKPLKDKK